jgi:hypothetical protein
LIVGSLLGRPASASNWRVERGKPLQVDVTSESGPYTVSNTYLLPQARQSPRFVRLSVQYDF